MTPADALHPSWLHVLAGSVAAGIGGLFTSKENVAGLLKAAIGAVKDVALAVISKVKQPPSVPVFNASSQKGQPQYYANHGAVTIGQNTYLYPSGGTTSPLKGAPSMSGIAEFFQGALKFIETNPWLTAEASDDARLAFALLTGDTASVAPDVKAALAALPIDPQYLGLLTSDVVVNALADELIKVAGETKTAAQAAPPTPATPEEAVETPAQKASELADSPQ